MPKEGSFISFNHHNWSMKVPFVFYADFEAFTEEISTCEPNKNFLLPNNIKNTNQVDFAINVLVLTQKGAFFIE